MIRIDRKLDQNFVVNESDSPEACSIQPPQSQLRSVSCDRLEGSIARLREADPPAADDTVNCVDIPSNLLLNSIHDPTKNVFASRFPLLPDRLRQRVSRSEEPLRLRVDTSRPLRSIRRSRRQDQLLAVRLSSRNPLTASRDPLIDFSFSPANSSAQLQAPREFALCDFAIDGSRRELQ